MPSIRQRPSCQRSPRPADGHGSARWPRWRPPALLLSEMTLLTAPHRGDLRARRQGQRRGPTAGRWRSSAPAPRPSSGPGLTPSGVTAVRAYDPTRRRRKVHLQHAARRRPDVAAASSTRLSPAATSSRPQPPTSDGRRSHAGTRAARMHVNAIGGDCPGKTELDPALLRRPASSSFLPQSQLEGEIQQLEGVEDDRVVACNAGEQPGRAAASEVTSSIRSGSRSRISPHLLCPRSRRHARPRHDQPHSRPRRCQDLSLHPDRRRPRAAVHPRQVFTTSMICSIFQSG